MIFQSKNLPVGAKAHVAEYAFEVNIHVTLLSRPYLMQHAQKGAMNLLIFHMMIPMFQCSEMAKFIRGEPLKVIVKENKCSFIHFGKITRGS